MDATSPTRRTFVRSSTTAAAGLALSGAMGSTAGQARTIKVGLVGCGRRRTGAAIQALRADPQVELTAVGDVFQDRVDKGLKRIRSVIGERVKVTPERCYLGFDSYQRVLDSG